MKWKRTRLDRVATVNARIGWKALTASEYQPDGYVFLATPNIKHEMIDFREVNYVNEYRYHESPELKLQIGDVLLAKDGNTLGITNIVRELPRPATVNGSIAVLRPFAVEPRFLRYALASSSTQGTIEAIKGGMGVPHLFQWDIKRLPLDLPHFEEQRRIADFLDAETTRLDNVTALIMRQLKVLDDRHQAIIDIELDRISVTTPIKYIARVGYGLGQPPKLSEGGIPILRATNIKRGKFVQDDLIFSTAEDLPLDRAPLLSEGEILVVRSGAYTGDSAVVTREWAGCVPGYDLRLTPLNGDPKFIQYCLLSMAVQDQVDLAKSRAAQPHLNAEDLGNAVIPMPQLDEQRRIADFLDAETAKIDQLTEIRKQQLAVLGERRQALITAAVTGGITV